MTKEKKIAVLAGDGIGPEVMAAACAVVEEVGRIFGHKFKLQKALIGGAAFDEFRSHCPEETLKICRSSEAILFGSVGGPSGAVEDKWRNCEVNSILRLRKEFSFHANLRPARIYPELLDISPLSKSTAEKGADLLIVRELLGDIYFGDHLQFEESGKRAARDICEYDEDQIALIAATAFDAALKRNAKVTSVDKANVLATSRLWRSVVGEVHKNYSGVQLENMLVDNCAMQIIVNPSQFDVILTANLFGDILSDAASVLPGSLGLTPSASLNSSGFGLFEPSGGSAPDIAGKGIANPVAQILSAAMMLKYSFNMEKESRAIYRAVELALQAGYRTKDIAAQTSSSLSTAEFTEKVIQFLQGHF